MQIVIDMPEEKISMDCQRCKYNDEEEGCVFFSEGSGDAIDMPCRREEAKTREQLLQELSEQSTEVLAQALMYAKNLVMYGIDVTQKWDTVVAQSSALEQARYKGYVEGAESTYSEVILTDPNTGRSGTALYDQSRELLITSYMDTAYALSKGLTWKDVGKDNR